MPGFELRPKVSQDGKLLQLRYELPHRVNTAKIYPLPSPNGSTIIIYGHEHGLRILWRGGRPLKGPRETPKEDKPAVNGLSDDVIMIIDSEEEQPPHPPPPFTDESIFKEEEKEYDPSEPYAPIIQHLDLILNTEVLHLTFPPLPNSSGAPLPDSVPPIATQKIVMAVACADNSVRVITLPLTPPSAASKGREELKRNVLFANAGHGKWGEKMLVISGNSGHQRVPGGVAVTFSPNNPTPFDSPEMVRDHNSNPDGQHDNTQSDSESRAQPSAKTQEWDVLLASHSEEGSGLLFVFRIPILGGTLGNNDYNISTLHGMPLQTLYLSSPAVTASFNPSRYPSTRHSQLLIVDSKGAVRIYDCYSTLPKAGGSATGRHSSDYRTSSADEGSWLGSFYPGFASRDFGSEEMSAADSKGSTMGMFRNTNRKSIIDAQWVNGGRGIIALTTDGEWGVWDIEGMGPGSRKSNILGGEIGRQRVQGGAYTRWSFSGRVDKSSVNSGRRSEDLASPSGKPTYMAFAPMTPGTRKTRQEALFSSSGKLGTIGGYNRGGISVSSPSMTGSTKSDGDLVIIWFEDTIIKIPNLWAYWEAQLRNDNPSTSGNLFSSSLEAASQTWPMKLENVNLRREKCCGVVHFPPIPVKGPVPPRVTGHRVEVNKIAKSLYDFRGEILVTGEHRLVILSGIEPTAEERARILTSDHVGEQLPTTRDLDVNGIDDMLERMENVDQKRGLAGKRKVGFLSPS
ncbi:hypothetical protein FGG08_005930 [Glutinoglossum americanum]|uniref:Nucleoporin NUP37 n=1 Tax=Glutinoglossum americanum TaxID=1670608 RepID=A0A9P8KVJ1_9PEZI|nr:hypothetical protein FGG08_005930 [Glutinoglossum americanum]